MKKIMLIVITIMLLISCEKEEMYTNSGVLPSIEEEKEEPTLDGTTWVLTKFTKGFVTEYPNDTIKFNNLFYSINGKENTDNYVYRLTGIMDLGNPYNLVLYGFSPFGDNGVWSATIVNTFIDEWEINLTEFTNTKSSVSKIKANFIRIE